MRTFSVPGWVIFAGSTMVASIFAGGAMALLLMGRPIPTELWVLLTAIGTAYFGSGPFSVALQHLAAAGQQAGTTNAALVDTVNHSVAVLNQAVVGTTRTATTMAGAATGGTTGGTATGS